MNATGHDTHSKTIGYLLWIFGFTGAHRFYYGKTKTGVLWFFTLGLLGVGWLIDLFLIPAMDREADRRFAQGSTDYTVAWALLTFLGPFGTFSAPSESTDSTWARLERACSILSPAVCC